MGGILTIKELGEIEFTNLQLKALSIEATNVNHGTLTDLQYLTEQITGILDGYVSRNIKTVQKSSVAEAFDKEPDEAVRLAVAQLLHVDIDIKPKGGNTDGLDVAKSN